MQCKDFESVFASEELGPLSAEAREHLDGCSRCQDFLADIDSIVAVARKLPAEVTPPERIWISLRAQMEAEGLIKEAVAPPERSSWLDNLGAWLRPRSLAAASATFAVVVAAVILTRLPVKTHVADKPPAPPVGSSAQPTAPVNAPDSPATSAIASGRNPTPGPSKIKELAPSPSETASNTLSEAELDVSNMHLAGNGNVQVDASLRQNLHTLNEFIAECEQHLRQNPQDELAREYLNIAYQQKADLLAAMMESGRSEH